MPKIIFNHKILDENKIKFSIYNRAFLYGDGLFESIKIINGKPFNLEAHLKRLFSASILFDLQIRTTKKNLKNKITLLIKENKIENAGNLKIIRTSFGEKKSSDWISDNPNNKQKSVYGIDAMLERKIEIINISFQKKNQRKEY